MGKSPHHPTSQEVTEIASKFGGAERLKEAIEQLQLLLSSNNQVPEQECPPSISINNSAGQPLAVLRKLRTQKDGQNILNNLLKIVLSYVN